MVSAPALPRYFIQFKKRAKRMPNTIMEIVVSMTPSTTPMAIPVIAECPRASEKKAIRLLTIIVPSRPKSGVMRMTARKACRINSYSNISVLLLFARMRFMVAPDGCPAPGLNPVIRHGNPVLGGITKGLLKGFGRIYFLRCSFFLHRFIH